MKKINRREFLRAMGLAAGMTALAGCGAGSTASQAVSAAASTASSAAVSAASEPVTIGFWTISLQPTFTDFFNGLFADYQKANPNVTINWTDLPYDSIQEKLVTAAASGDCPDVVNLNSEMALTLAGKNAVVDMNAEATEEQRSIYISSLYNSCKLGDSVYAFPWYGSPNVMFINNALMKQAGLTDPPKYYNSEDSFAMAKTMKDKTGAYLYNPYKLLSMLMYDGLPILNDAKTAAAFNNSDTVTFVNGFKTMVDGGYFATSKWGDWDEEVRLFESGKLAIISSSGSTLSRIKDEAPDIYNDLTITYPMVGKLDLAANPLMDVVVPEASKNHEEAIKFASFITNDDSQLKFCKQVAIFPSTTKACSDSYFTSDTQTPEGKARAISAEISPKCGDFSLGVTGYTDIAQAFDNLEEALFANNTDVSQALTTAEGDVNKALAQ